MKRIIIGLLFLTIIIHSCISEKDIEVENIREFRIENLSGSGMLCSADVEIRNNYFLPLTIENGDVYAYVGDEKVGTVKLLNPIELKSKSKKLYSLKFDINITQPLVGLQSILGTISGKKPSYRLKGTLKAKQLFITREIEFDKSLSE